MDHKINPKSIIRMNAYTIQSKGSDTWFLSTKDKIIKDKVKNINEIAKLINILDHTILLVFPGAVFNNTNSVPSELMAVALAVFDAASIIIAIKPINP